MKADEIVTIQAEHKEFQQKVELEHKTSGEKVVS